MRIRFSALPIGFMLFALALSCASRSAYSDECDADIPASDVTISSLNGQPEPKTLDLHVQRVQGASSEVTIDLAVVRRVNWCMRGYFGPLTLAWANLPEGMAVAFDPASLDPHTDNYRAQKGKLRLSIPASVPDGTFSLNLQANEHRVRVAPFRINLSTKPD
ncbi:MAG: hypothetical protein A3K04_08255 [Gallionellales bacterium RBG_16_56_9]|nr:MAG: hypothetical protein A3K04_08255 [Gallionellales bacterium RBG_16_56_9]